MGPGAFHKVILEHFLALATKCSQKASRKFVLSFFMPWPSNAAGGFQKAHMSIFGVQQVPAWRTTQAEVASKKLFFVTALSKFTHLPFSKLTL